MKTLKLFSLKAIGGFEGKIFKYRKAEIRVNRLETSTIDRFVTVPDGNDHGVISHPEFGLIFVFVEPLFNHMISSVDETSLERAFQRSLIQSMDPKTLFAKMHAIDATCNALTFLIAPWLVWY